MSLLAVFAGSLPRQCAEELAALSRQIALRQVVGFRPPCAEDWISEAGPAAGFVNGPFQTAAGEIQFETLAFLAQPPSNCARRARGEVRIISRPTDDGKSPIVERLKLCEFEIPSIVFLLSFV